MSKDNIEEIEEASVAKQDKQRNLVLNQDSIDGGAISITANVVAQIIKKNVLDVPGVARFAPKGMADLVNVFSSRAYDSSISIEFVDGSISVTIAVLAFLNVSLPEMAREIQERLRSKIAEATGANVSKVNILVKDLVDPETAAEEAEESAAEAVPGAEAE